MRMIARVRAAHIVHLWPVWLPLGRRDVHLQFRGFVLGTRSIFAYLAINLFTIGVVYSVLLEQESGQFIFFSAIGVVTWGCLTFAITQESHAFIASEGSINQIGLPHSIYLFLGFVHVVVTILISLYSYGVVALGYRVLVGWAAFRFLSSSMLSDANAQQGRDVVTTRFVSDTLIHTLEAAYAKIIAERGPVRV